MGSSPPVARWPLVPLGKLITISHGFAFKGEYFRDVGPGDILVTPGSFAIGGGFVERKAKYYNGPVDARYVLDAGDLIVTMTDLSRASDTLGFGARVPPPPDGARFLHNQRIGRVQIIDASQLDPGFLYAVLRSQRYRAQVVATATGTTVRHTSPSRIQEVLVPLPPITDQGRISDIVSTLDQKIEGNRRLASLLEETAATLFRARFTDFVGVEKFDDTSVGPVPYGWHAGKLGDLVRITMGQSPRGSTYSDDSSGGLLMVQGMGGFGVRFPTSAVYTSAPTKRARAGATLMTVRAPVGAVNVAGTELCVGRGVAALDSDRQAFTEFLIRSLEPRWASEESGTIFPAVNRAQISNLPIPIPPQVEIDAFERFADPLVQKLAASYAEYHTLGALRHALLPKLISGEMRVPRTVDPAEVIEPMDAELAAR